MKILEYLSLHQIIDIGIEYSDIIVDNPFDFADDMASMHYFVTEILWWERTAVCNSKHSIGHGGPKDPRDDNYYFSETELSKSFTRNSTSDQIQNYLNFIYHEYSQYCLYPSFSIEKIKTR